MTYQLVCQGCGVTFEAKSPRAKWHAPGCKKRVQRNPESAVDAAIAAGANQEPTAETEYGRDVLASVRRDLEAAGALDTPRGRVAIYLARQSISPDCKNPAGMFKQMLDALDAAIAAAAPSDPTPAEPAQSENEVEKARRKRAAKAANGTKS